MEMPWGPVWMLILVMCKTPACHIYFRHSSRYCFHHHLSVCLFVCLFVHLFVSRITQKLWVDFFRVRKLGIWKLRWEKSWLSFRRLGLGIWVAVRVRVRAPAGCFTPVTTLCRIEFPAVYRDIPCVLYRRSFLNIRSRGNGWRHGAASSVRRSVPSVNRPAHSARCVAAHVTRPVTVSTPVRRPHTTCPSAPTASGVTASRATTSANNASVLITPTARSVAITRSTRRIYCRKAIRTCLQTTTSPTVMRRYGKA